LTSVELPESLVPAARVLFADRLPLAQRYADLLAGDGVVRGLIGPREAPRIWDRHLLNCAVVAAFVPDGASVTDVGSGAGLPGIVLALARPDLTVVLVEPMARRTAFLEEAVAALDLGERVSVVRGRAEELAGRLALALVVTARAVAPLDRLAAWCLPLTSVGGRVLAVKGASALDEVVAHRAAVARLGGGSPVVHQAGVDLLPEPTTVVEIVRSRVVAAGPRERATARRRTR
jgi:16S rRNA (guanine527-N7)-methyltransferase